MGIYYRELGEAADMTKLFRGTVGPGFWVEWSAAQDAEARATFASLRIRPTRMEQSQTGRQEWSARVTLDAWDKLRPMISAEALL